MATGIVLSIDPSGTTGQVQVDETGETIAFNDANFPNTGLTATAPNNSCTFDIDLVPQTNRGSVAQYYATNMQVAPPPRNQSITSAVTQDITALVGDIITISTAAAVVTGNITINGGKVIVDQDAQITGNVTVNSDGIFVARNKGKIMGSIGINSGGSLKVVNKGKIVGNIGISQGGRMIIGNQNGGGIVTGAISIASIRSVSITADSTINCPGS
jgi:hypothetical protein